MEFRRGSSDLGRIAQLVLTGIAPAVGHAHKHGGHVQHGAVVRQRATTPNPLVVRMRPNGQQRDLVRWGLPIIRLGRRVAGHQAGEPDKPTPNELCMRIHDKTSSATARPRLPNFSARWSAIRSLKYTCPPNTRRMAKRILIVASSLVDRK